LFNPDLDPDHALDPDPDPDHALDPDPDHDHALDHDPDHDLVVALGSTSTRATLTAPPLSDDTAGKPSLLGPCCCCRTRTQVECCLAHSDRPWLRA
jgi:hypothetical protein